MFLKNEMADLTEVLVHPCGKAVDVVAAQGEEKQEKRFRSQEKPDQFAGDEKDRIHCASVPGSVFASIHAYAWTVIRGADEFDTGGFESCFDGENRTLPHFVMPIFGFGCLNCSE